MAAGVEVRRPGRGRFLTDAIGIVAVWLLAFAAFDDITTDNVTDLTVEYAAMAVCGVGLLVASIRLLRGGHRMLGAVSLVAVAGALWAQRGIGHGIRPGFWPAYLVMAAVFLWFAGLGMFLFVSDSDDSSSG